MFSFKRRKVLRERADAAIARDQAAKDLSAALGEAEEALGRLKAANDKFYHSDVVGEHVALSTLRRERERTFAFHTVCEVVSEAPHLARLLGIKVHRAHALPLAEWVASTTRQDLGQAAGQEQLQGEPS